MDSTTAGKPHCEDDRPVVPELAGLTELCTMFGVGKQRTYQLTIEPGFPIPLAKLNQGRIWDAEEARTWFAKRFTGVNRAERRAH